MKIEQKSAWALGLAGIGLCTWLGQAQNVPVYEKTETAESAPAQGETITNAPVIVQAAAPPADLRLSPGLSEVVRLIQAGVGEDVLLAYIKNSTNVYFLGSEEVIYLNDLGVSSEVLTAMIERDNTPEALAHKARVGAAAPLPPGVALTSPAADIYVTTPTATLAEPPAQPVIEEAPAEPIQGEAGGAPVTEVAAAPDASVNYFYDALSPYGNWVQVDNYGLCWQPTVAVVNTQWRPYSDRGRWLWSSSGWYWYSDYSWGWAPFHYGRWHRSPGHGWLWVPGSVWGPSWVTWRYNDGYCGWAPLPPYARYSSGFGLTYHSDSVHFGFGFGFGYHDYVFVPWGRFHDYYPHRHYVHGHAASVIYRSSQSANLYARGRDNGVINRGMGRDLAARRSRRNIEEVVVRPEARPVTQLAARPERLVRAGGSMSIVRPQLPDTPPQSSIPRPSASGALRTRGSGAGQPSRVSAFPASGGAALSGPIGRSQARSVAPAASGGSSIDRSAGPIVRPQVGRPGVPSSPQRSSVGRGGTGGTGATRSSGPVGRSQTRIVPRVQSGVQGGGAVVRPNRPTSGTVNRSTGVARAPFEPVARTAPSFNSRLRSVHTPPPSVNTRPPSVITRPPSVNTRPPSAITRPPSVNSRPPSAITRPPSRTGSRSVTRSVPVFPGVQASPARPRVSTPRAISRPAPVVRPSRPATRSAPSPAVSRPAPQVSAPAAGGSSGRASRGPATRSSGRSSGRERR